MSIHRDGEFVFDESGMSHTFQSYEGPTGRFVISKSEELEGLARISAGFDTGQLIASLETDYGKHETSGDLESKVGANARSPIAEKGYALWHHEGTYPHWISPKRIGGVLKFRSRGMVVFARRVWHPGNTPNKYLTRWLRNLF